jgi:large subunit ribosomal protein L31
VYLFIAWHYTIKQTLNKPLQKKAFYYNICELMKKEIHPQNYRKVIFVDDTSGEKFLIASTVKSGETDKWTDGKEYPLVHVEISSASHPFYTGKETVVDTAGRVEKFKARMAKKSK